MERTLRDQLTDAYMASIPLISLNVLWFFVSLLIVTLIPATGALFYTMNLIAHGKSASFGDFFEGFRRYFWVSWRWGLLNVVIIAAGVASFTFYATSETSVLSLAAQMVVGGILALWLLLQVYMFPLIFEQEQPSLRTALRNSLVISAKFPLRSIGTLLLIALVMLLTTLVIYPAWIFITASLSAYLANRATVYAVTQLKGATAAEPLQGD